MFIEQMKVGEAVQRAQPGGYCSQAYMPRFSEILKHQNDTLLLRRVALRIADGCANSSAYLPE